MLLYEPERIDAAVQACGDRMQSLAGHSLQYSLQGPGRGHLRGSSCQYLHNQTYEHTVRLVRFGAMTLLWTLLLVVPLARSMRVTLGSTVIL